MKYLKQYKGEDEVKEITKEEARRTLERWWKDEALEDIFNNDKCFRLYTPFSEIWTVTESGIVPVAGFYGVTG